jgi:hypothetical protein
MAADSSFDVTTKIDRMELDNAINQAVREIETRFDFKNTVSKIELEGDKDCRDVNMTFYVNTTTPFWKPGFNRFRAAWDILVHGYREDQHTLILNKQSALNVATAITTVIEELEEKKNGH